MGFKSGGDNKETLHIQAPDGEQSSLTLKSDVSCFIRLEADIADCKNQEVVCRSRLEPIIVFRWALT